VRGNGKIIQELEGEFRGAGWNVIKLIWGTHWDALFERDKKGILKKRMMEIVDGEYQTFKAKNGAYVREHFFNTPELKELVADWTDDRVWRSTAAATTSSRSSAPTRPPSKHKGQPTLILAKTIKGYGMGEAGEAMNISHQQKKMDAQADLIAFPRPLQAAGHRRPDRRSLPYLKFAEGSPNTAYMRERRAALGGFLPQRRRQGRTAGDPAARRPSTRC
jgi:pyruvate dehydrogenase E1 component